MALQFWADCRGAQVGIILLGLGEVYGDTGAKIDQIETMSLSLNLIINQFTLELKLSA